MTADEKYFLLNRNNLLQGLQMQLSQKRKTFSQIFFFHFRNLDSSSKISPKKMTLIADVFLDFRTAKNVVR